MPLSVMEILNFSKEEIIKQIDKSLRTVVSQFYYYPYLFFNENGFRDYFFAVFYRNKFFSASNLITTKGDKKTNLLHPEYSSAELFPNKKGRAWYDMVILNPEFIKNNEYNRVIAKDVKSIRLTSYKNDDLLVVFELKFIRHLSKNYKNQLEKDHISLKNAKEALIKNMIVFSSIQEDLDFYKDKNWSKNFRLVYIKVYFDEKNKKHVEVIIKPDNFLNLPSKWIRNI